MSGQNAWEQQDARPFPEPKARPKFEVIPESTTIYVSQRMSDGTTRDLEINADAIVGSIDFGATYYHPRMRPSRSGMSEQTHASRVDVTLRMKLDPEQAVKRGGEPWALKFYERPPKGWNDPMSSEQPADGQCTDPNCTLKHEPATTTFMGQPAMNERARHHTASAAASSPTRKTCERCGVHAAGYIANDGTEDIDLCACCYGEPHDANECAGQPPLDDEEAV